MADITYCINSSCPFNECERHSENIPDDCRCVSIANFDGVCRDYIGYLVEGEEKDG